MKLVIIMAILENFGEDVHGRDCHGHSSNSKKTLKNKYLSYTSPKSKTIVRCTIFIFLNLNGLIFNLLCKQILVLLLLLYLRVFYR
jgi:hypothetical protein